MTDERDAARPETSDKPSVSATPHPVERKDAPDLEASKYLHTEAAQGPEQAAREPNNEPAHAPVGADDIADQPDNDLYERLADKDVSPRG